MSLSNPRVVFGIHSISPYNSNTGEFYGIAKVLGNVEFALSGDLPELFGGSSKFAWSIQEGTVKSDIKVTLKEYPDFMFELLLGKAVTENAAETSGSVTAITNKKGTSVVAATGIATVTVKSGAEADVKFAYFVVKAASATTVNVYGSSDVDFLRGTDGAYQDDTLKLLASALTITATTAVTITGFGLELTGGAGAIGMTTGDTATFRSRPINTASMDVTIGASGDVNPEFGMIVVPEKLGDGRMWDLDIFRCKAVGLPFPFGEKKFSEPSISIKAFQDTSRGGVFKVRHVTPSSFV